MDFNGNTWAIVTQEKMKDRNSIGTVHINAGS